MIERNHIYCMDCMDGMAQMADKSIDLAIVDPPYGIGWDGENPTMTVGLRKDGTIRKDKTWANRDITNIKYQKKEWDTKRPNQLYFNHLKRVSKNQIIWGGNYFTDFLSVSPGIVIWDKKTPERFSLSMGELAFVSCSKRLQIFRYLWSGYAKQKPEIRIHPTQKPVALYKWLLQNYAKEGDLILDTHMGSGSSYIACLDMRFDYIGFEIDSDYFAAIEERAYHATRQLSLFGGNPRSDVT